MQPPSDRTNKNPYATPSAWPRAPQQTFHLQVPKPPAGAPKAAQPVQPPRPPQPPKRPAPSILTGSALPAGYTAPLGPPDIAFDEPIPPAAPPPVEPEVERAPSFIAPPETPFVAPIHTESRRASRLPLFVAAAVAAAAGLGAAAWLLMREPAPVALEPVTMPAPAASAPVITPPSLDYIMIEPEEPDASSETFSAPVTRTRPSESAAAVEMPSGPVAYSGSATPPVQAPVAVRPAPAPPPPVSAPGPTPPVADPDSPQSTRDPTSGN